MIVVVWTVALIVSLAPQFGWKDPDYLYRINTQQKCLVSQDVAYQVSFIKKFQMEMDLGLIQIKTKRKHGFKC